MLHNGGAIEKPPQEAEFLFCRSATCETPLGGLGSTNLSINSRTRESIAPPGMGFAAVVAPVKIVWTAAVLRFWVQGWRDKGGGVQARG
jgi:hypothetical protein